MTGDAPNVRPPRHPGAGRGRAAAHPKGRIVSPEAAEEVQALLGDRPRRRDLLIEHLHLIQDAYRGLSPAHLTALADEMRLSLAEVYEVATFYAHFDVLRDGQAPPPAVTVRVCDGVTCRLFGADRLLDDLAERLAPDVRVVPAPCVGRCESPPVAVVGRRAIGGADVRGVVAAVASGRLDPDPPDAIRLDEYIAAGGYETLRACLAGRVDRDEVVARVEASGLRGLGGAGFPSGQKWRFVRQGPAPRLLAINADEGEPGTFKDRHYLETDPHRVLEGMLIAGWAVEADTAYFYLRDEYHPIRALLIEEVAAIEAAGLAEPGAVRLRRGAGAYICGEETAMLESIEGKRGLPRHKPPFPTQVGLFGRPTLIHNVETVTWLRAILENPPGWFLSHGRNGRKGLRSFSVSGRVRSPGVVLAPAGTTVRELIDEHCGGMIPGHTFAAYLPGGASGGILPATLGDVPLDFGTIEPHGGFIGSAAVVVLSDRDDPRDVAIGLMRFFEHESCGQCTPCRSGTAKAVGLMSESVWDEALLKDLSAAMRDASICGLGQAAPNPLLSVLRHFPEATR